MASFTETIVLMLFSDPCKTQNQILTKSLQISKLNNDGSSFRQNFSLLSLIPGKLDHILH